MGYLAVMRLQLFVRVLAAFGVCTVTSAAFAQSTLPLRQSIDDAEAAIEDPVVTPVPLPAEPPPPPPRRRAAADPYAPLGISVGAAQLYPSITIGSAVTSNVARTPKNREADIGLFLRPSLRTESDWVRHSWSSNISGDLTYYAGRDDLNARDLDLSQRLRLDVRRGTTAEFETGYALSQSGLEDSDVPATAVGLQTEHTMTSSAAFSHDFGGVEGRVRAGATWRIIEDVKLSGGGKQDNDDREYIEPSLSLRATLTDPPVFKPFAEVAYTPRIHNLTFDRNGLRRDSDGYSGSIGVNIDNGPIWTGDLALTYLYRTYDDPALDDNSALGINGNLTWSPTDLTRIVWSMGTSLNESTSATSSGSRTWTFGWAGTYDIRENVTIGAGSGVELEKGEGGLDITYDANLAVSWKLNPALAWTAGYDLTWLDAASGGRGYSEHRVTTGMTLSR